ncbi:MULTISPECIES: hypothetical protein [Massilia]|uniref:Uncharacterized protein n=2 Tax=Massilia TaxID=149698 RepID=A0A422QL50_9BURK|nr:MULTISPECIES: hypothetical protein [Massilia]MDY0962647.1 hypothetical protein [Massilia sp. CFBP9026]RNF30718.1 hypothetical protein NM04_11035 [Massilia aurea]TXG00479.1 hypothetical protein FVD38_08960 [Massilia arenae]
MKRFTNLAALAALTLAASTYAHAQAQQTLETPGFTVKITQQCEEGNVTCDDVRYVGTSKKSGKAISLRGKTMHSLAADGVTPGAFQGYVFKSGRVTYTVFADGRLVVTEGKKTLVNQRGEWK